MSIFDNARTSQKGAQRIDTLRPVLVDVDCDKTGLVADTIDRSHEYVVRLSIAQNFWANDAQRDRARASALKAIAYELYADVLKELPRLRLAIESGDREACREAALRIEKATQP